MRVGVLLANERSWGQKGACGGKQEVLEFSKRARVVGKRRDEEATAILVTSNLKWPRERNTPLYAHALRGGLVHIAVAAPSNEHVEGGVSCRRRRGVMQA